MNEAELIEMIKNGREERNIEYKRSIPWSTTDNREKIIRTILSMANLRDGGFIVIGMNLQPDNSYTAEGISEADKSTYNEDHMADAISEFADPYVNFSVHTFNYDSKAFLVIQVNEFEEIPVICKRDGGVNLKRGKTYIRSKKKPESIEVPTQSEMREILEIAIEKGIRKFFARIEKTGVEVSVRDNEKLFADQIKDLD